MTGGEREPPEMLDPQQSAADLEERSGLIADTRDAAFQRGFDDWDPSCNRDEAAASYDDERLAQDFRDGWDEAQREWDAHLAQARDDFGDPDA